jgi:hypothetical protein
VEIMTTAGSPALWADVITLGRARFGQLEGGPFDGHCYPLLEGTPQVLDVPPPGTLAQKHHLRYVLRDGRYRFQGEVAEPAAA